jgi:calcium-dependent protein kinase
VLKETGEIRAVKLIEKEKMEENEKVRLKYEIEILKNLMHPNIVRLYEVYESKETIFLVTELCDGRELFDEIVQRKKFTEKNAANVLKQLLQAIAYCHERHICHRDLKPENVLIDAEDQIKVIDFGTS